MKITLFFGLAFDDRVALQGQRISSGQFYVGPEKLLKLLERWMGLVHPSRDIEHLRVEQYRQVLLEFKQANPDVFYAKAFEASQFATSKELLRRRDELVLAGWDFASKNDLPNRLSVLAGIENAFENKLSEVHKGYADRFKTVLEHLDDFDLPVSDFLHHEPFRLLPVHLRLFMEQLKSRGVKVAQIDPTEISGTTDLDLFRKSLSTEFSGNAQLKSDNSLLVLKGKTESSMATWLAHFLKVNESFRPVCVVPGKSGTLDNAFIQEGLPGMGMQSASLARPSLQILKLLPAFLWEPTDPFKILEFVSLAVKPLEEELSRRIAEQIAEKPGLHGEAWKFMIRQYFSELESKGHNGINKIRSQYRMWFDRKRYNTSQKVPKTEVLELYSYLRDWAIDIFEELGSNNPTLLVLSEQARRICELVEAQPEQEFNNLQLEYIVRTIYQPAPLQIQEEQKGRLEYVRLPGAIFERTEQLLWWNFTQNEQEHFFSPWYKNESRWLSENVVFLQSPSDKNALLLWHRIQPVLRTTQQLILVVPEIYEGTEVNPHPLLGNLEALYGDLSPITIDLENADETKQLSSVFTIPAKEPLQPREVGQKKAFLKLKSNVLAQQREKETITGLESLFYYPYKWAFQYKAKLRKSPILSVVSDNRLLGNLAHRFFEILFEDPEAVQKMSKAEVERKVDIEMEQLLIREGAVLLLYGREPERLAFINKLKFASWSLVTLIRSNGWSVVQTEKPLEGVFAGTEIKGRADLVLEKNGQQAIVDIKWRGSSRRERELKNEEDLQLVLYAKLLPPDQEWAPTAYFIIENGKMIARNGEAFKEAVTVSPEADINLVYRQIIDRMEATMQWRMDQLKEGLVEIRCRQTLAELEETYGAEQLDILEMKDKDAPFDDYKVLIGLVD